MRGALLCSFRNFTPCGGEEGFMCACVCQAASVVSDSATPCTIAHQAPLSMGFSGQEHLSGLTFPSPEDLPDPGFEPVSPAAPALQADSLLLSHQKSLKDLYSGNMI